MPPFLLRTTTGGSTGRGFASGLRRVSPTVRLLLACELGFNVGFYMLVPFIAGELHRRGVSAAAVGLVLGTRSLSQQGLFPLGGWVADRVGPKPAILLGCFVRAIGFALFGASRSLWALLTAAALSGLGAALFTPAMKAWIARDAGQVAAQTMPPPAPESRPGEHGRPSRPGLGLARSEAFALAVMASQIGALTGPLIGVLLLPVGFAGVALGAGAIFLAFGALAFVCLPKGSPQPGPPDAPGLGARAVFQNRPFLAFVSAMAGYAVLFNQLFLLLPLALTEATGTDAGAAWLFAITALLVLLLQRRIAGACARRWSAFAAAGRGLVVMGLAFVPGALAVTIPASDGPRILTGAVVAGTGILAFGMMMAHPFAMDLIAVLARERGLGLHYGVYYGAGGLAATAGSALAGLVYDQTRHSGTAALLWIAHAALGLVCGFVVLSLGRRRLCAGAG